MKISESEFEKILESLHSEEGKVKLIEELIHKGEDFTQRYIVRAANFYGLSRYAAKIVEKSAENALNSGYPDKARMLYNIAVSYYEEEADKMIQWRKDNLERALYVAKKGDLEEKTKELIRTLIQEYDVTTLNLEKEDIEKIAETDKELTIKVLKDYEKSKMYNDAERFAKKIGLNEDVDNYRRIIKLTY